MSFGFLSPWHGFLPRMGGHIVAVMGSGGKTSLLREFAAVYAELGLDTLLTTTTRCEVLTGVSSVSWEAVRLRGTASPPTGSFVYSGCDGLEKWTGLAPEEVDALSEKFPERVVLVEVDGAAKHPLKLYRPDEPVWPGRTSLAVVVMGVGAVGAQMGRVVHRWRDVAFPPFACLPDYQVMEWSHLRSLLLAENGYLAQIPEGVPPVLALTGLEVQDDAIGLFEFVGQVMTTSALPLVMFCSRTGESLVWQIRTAYAEDRP